MSKRITFIGLGNMGAPMAANLLKAGHIITGFDLDRAARDAAVSRGIEVATGGEESVEGADVLITMLPAGKHVMAVWRDLVPRLSKRALAIDCSTIDVASATGTHQIASSAGCLSLDAPVSGGISGATAATLTFMVGGNDEAFELAKPILEIMGKRVVHCGDAGAGQAAKICNNMILGASMIAVAEAFVLGEKLGLKHQALFDVVSTSSGQCWSVNTYCPVPGPVPSSPANNSFKPGFAAALMLKDLRLAQEAAGAVNAVTPMGAAAANLYALFNQLGGAGTDFSGIIDLIRGQSPNNGQTK